MLNLFNRRRGLSRFSQENDVGEQVTIDQADYYAGRADVAGAFVSKVARDPRFLQYESFRRPSRRE